MTSAIDATKPVGPVAYTLDVRGNFSTAASEISALQAAMDATTDIRAYGAKCDGTTDDTAAVNAAVAYVYNRGGGTVQFPHGTTLMLGAMVIPNNGATDHPRQNPIRLLGQGGSPDSYLGQHAGVPPLGGTILDMRYGTTPDGTHTAKIDTRGAGLLEIENLTLLDGGSSNYLFLFTTNTTLSVRNVVFRGNQANAGQACVQNAVLLGGSALTYGDNSATSAFQGYGTRFKDCFFHNIHVAIGFGSSCNGVYAENCSVDISCGSSDAQGAPFVFLGQGNGAIGNVLIGCIVEVSNYPYAAAFIGSNNQLNTLLGVGVWDQTAVTKAGFYFSATSVTNVVLGSFTQGNIVNQMTDGPGASYNMIMHGRSVSVVPWLMEVGHGADTSSLTIAGGNTNTNDGSALLFTCGGATVGGIGNYSGIYGGAYNNQFTLYGAGHGIVLPSDVLNCQAAGAGLVVANSASFGSGAGNPIISVNGGNSGTSVGPAIELQFGGVQHGGLFGYSAFFGGAYDSRTLLSGYDGLVFTTANAIGATLDTSHNFNVVGLCTGTAGLQTGVAGPTWTTGSAAPSAVQPVGSLYSRVGGAIGATLYVSRGAGTWAAAAGV